VVGALRHISSVRLEAYRSRAGWLRACAPPAIERYPARVQVRSASARRAERAICFTVRKTDSEQSYRNVVGNARQGRPA
jgi:hypothetical protein